MPKEYPSPPSMTIDPNKQYSATFKTSRGEMHDDPIVFAMRDWNSRITIAFIALAALVAHFVHLDL